jgi:light-regulated signal transduction histidine kinase (bacteriophytochrome)
MRDQPHEESENRNGPAEERIRSLESTIKEQRDEIESLRKEFLGLTYTITHDLRAPLRAVDGFSKAILEDFGASLDPKAKDYLERVTHASRQMFTLLDELNQWSKVLGTDVHLEPLDVCSIVVPILARLKDRDLQRNVSIECEEGLQVVGDRRMVHLLLEKLLQNAWKFTQKTPEARIQIGSTFEEGKKGVFVRDNGVGFDPEYAGKLFIPFQRLHHISEFPGGSGMGLAIAKKIIQKHGGTIRGEGSPGRGAVFFFSLPSEGYE